MCAFGQLLVGLITFLMYFFKKIYYTHRRWYVCVESIFQICYVDDLACSVTYDLYIYREINTYFLIYIYEQILYIYNIICNVYQCVYSLHTFRYIYIWNISIDEEIAGLNGFNPLIIYGLCTENWSHSCSAHAKIPLLMRWHPINSRVSTFTYSIDG